MDSFETGVPLPHAMAEIVEVEGAAELELPPKIAVGVGKGQSSYHALLYALDNLVLPGQTVHLLHVQAPLRFIRTPMGNSLPVEQVSENVVKKFKHENMVETQKLLSQYLKMSDRRKVKTEVYYLENESVPKELVNQIFKLGIAKLVIGTSTQGRITRALKGEGRSSYLVKNAPDFCTVVVVYKEKVASTKSATSSFSLERGLRTSPSTSSDGSSDTIEEDLLSRDGTHLDFPQYRSASMDYTRASSEWLLMHGNSTPATSSTTPRLVSTLSYQPRRRPFESAPSTPFGRTRHHTNSLLYPSTSSSSINKECRDQAMTSIESESNDELYEHWEGRVASPVSLQSNTLATLMIGACDTSSSALNYELETRPPTSYGGLPSQGVPDSDDVDVVKNQRDAALREVELQANRCKQAWKMAEEYDAQRNLEIRRYHEALKEGEIAKQQVLKEARRSLELEAKLEVAMKEIELLLQNATDDGRKHEVLQEELDSSRRLVEASSRDAEASRQQAEVEKRRFEEAQEKLEEAMLAQECLKLSFEETKGALELETRLRKEADQKLLQEVVAKREALSALRREHDIYTEYTFKELQIATSNFHEKNKLGQGGYGPVYKGVLHHTTVAIKILAKEGLQGLSEFQREVQLLSRIHHPHMVMLFGACSERACIVYEYMANGSLEDRLNCKNDTPPLPWYIRFRICFEVAIALLFLHSRPEPIVHRDLKPGNILLDHNLVSKIGDVGIATLVPNDLTFNGLTRYKDTVPVGTFAYMDPDYQRTGVLSRESDVYALGMVMLQLLTGKPAVGVADLVEAAVDKGRLEDVLDKSAGEWPAEALDVACLSLQCTEPRRKHRPDLETKVLGILEKIRAVADLAAANMGCAGPSYSGVELVVPSFFICPIAQEIMEDPHIAADGFTYEKGAINEWLSAHNTSPMTNLRLSHKNLIPNHSLRSAIKEWQERGQIST